MELKKLIDDSLEFVESIKSYKYKFEDEYYFLNIEIEKNKYETIRIYKDIIETNILKEEIVIIDVSIELEDYYEYIEDFNFIDDYNRDTFFSKLYVDKEETFIIIESCLLYQNLNPKVLAFCIEEISDNIYDLKQYLSSLGGKI